MPRPLSHMGPSIAYTKNPIGKLVYASGAPQRVGIVRDVLPAQYPWDTKVLIEWQSGVLVWRRAGTISAMDGKIAEEERSLAAFMEARRKAAEHFGVS